MRARLPLSIACVALAVACTPALHVVDEPAPQRVQLDAAAIDAIARLLRMEDTRALDTMLVARLLTDDEGEVRGRAALAAGRIRDATATPLLLRALVDADTGVRSRAAFALGELGDTTAQVVAALTEVALGGVAAPAAEAAAALGQLGTANARPALELLLASDRIPRDVRENALLAIWRLPRSATSTSLVKPWTTHDDPETRWRAVYALSRLGGTSVVQPLLAALNDGDARVRMQALRGLRAPLVDSAGLRAATLPAVLDAAGDTHPHVRIGALRLLPAYRDAAATAVMVRSLGDGDANVAVAAAQALGDAGDASAAAALLAVAADTASADGLRAAALSSALRLDAGQAARTARAWADSARWLLRMQAARAFASADWSVAADPLQRLARDGHYLVAAEALSAMRSSADTLSAPRRLYVEQLGAAHPLVRAAALRGLQRIVGPADLDLLLQAYDRTRHDTDREAALAALEALEALARTGVPVQRVFYARFAEAPADAVIHRAIVRRIGAAPATWAAPLARPAAKPAAFYAEAARALVARTIAGEPAPQVGILTPQGEIVLELAAADAPLTVHNFLTLVEQGYYTGTRWHRVVPNFVIQDGDPRGDGTGGPGHTIRDEINPLRYHRGVLGMALSGPDTGGAQFFITHSPQPHLDGGYTVFGHVVHGIDVVDRIVQDDPILGFRRIR